MGMNDLFAAVALVSTAVLVAFLFRFFQVNSRLRRTDPELIEELGSPNNLPYRVLKERLYAGEGKDPETVRLADQLRFLQQMLKYLTITLFVLMFTLD